MTYLNPIKARNCTVYHNMQNNFAMPWGQAEGLCTKNQGQDRLGCIMIPPFHNMAEQQCHQTILKPSYLPLLRGLFSLLRNYGLHRSRLSRFTCIVVLVFYNSLLKLSIGHAMLCDVICRGYGQANDTFFENEGRKVYSSCAQVMGLGFPNQFWKIIYLFVLTC